MQVVTPKPGNIQVDQEMVCRYKASPKWDKQIARVDINPLGKVFYSNTDLPRLAYLNRAGNYNFAGTELDRAEAAVSPDYSKFC